MPDLQLAKLESTFFHVRDGSSNIVGNSKFNVIVATPKAHHQQGQVEAKINVMRKTLAAWSESTEQSNTVLGWETIFSRIASAVDDVPIA